MAKVITRFYDDVDEIKSVRKTLITDKKLPEYIVRTYHGADGLTEALTSKGVEKRTAQAYETRIEKGGAVLLVMADYTPLGVARITRETLAGSGAADMGDLPQEAIVPFVPGSARRVLRGGPLFLTRRLDRKRDNYFMADRPIPLLIDKQPSPDPVIPPHGRMASWPIGLLLPGHKRYGRFPFDLLIPGHKFMANFPFADLIPGHKFMANFPFGHIVPGHKFMANFPFGHIVPGHKFMANFPIGHLVPGHRRMANWPFPLLINGKRPRVPIPGGSSKFWAKKPIDHLVPGHKFQAKFPFGHIVPGHKFMAKFPFAHIVPGHKFMANFPFGHIVPGHKFMAKFPFGHIVPGHKYMANWIVPHTPTKDA
ncbi:MAG: hypothetical protein AAF727_14710 [Pseudomonadota bacterium]